jgi:glycerol-3-phosphate dehydrogenase
MPIAQMVQAVLDGKLDVREAVRGLMTRQLRSEHEHR